MNSQLDRRASVAAYVIFFVLVALAPLVLDGFWLNRLAKYLVYGMLGVAIAMCWGYAGILNLGQGLFFGIGAYMLAMSLKMASPTSLQHGGTGPVPDFMLSNAEPGAVIDLCCINAGAFLWSPFRHQSFGLLMGLLCGGLSQTHCGCIRLHHHPGAGPARALVAGRCAAFDQWFQWLV
jgi:urea transport system permease protein